MIEYYFLFLMALAWLIFAAVQDLRSTEISDWLNFSLIAFALSYRAFYSVFTENWMFFAYGAFGVLLFIGLAYLFYYGRIFGGGDAKLLMGLGGVLPFESFNDYFLIGIGFIFLLFFIGAVYSLIYSIFLVWGRRGDFSKDFSERFAKGKWIVFFAFILGIALGFINLYLGGFVIILPLLFFYVKSLDKCMIKSVEPEKLMEGDWLVKDVKAGNKIIKKTVHGLSHNDIMLLKKAGKKVLIKSGIPFAPVFLVTFLVFLWVLRDFPIQFYYFF